MEKNISKKLLAGVCALSGAFILAACDPITAVPTTYNDAIVNNADGTAVDTDDNKLGKIYDALATDRNTKIVSDILDEVAEEKFGSYYDIKKAAISTDEAVKLDYINKHGDVFVREGDDNAKKLHRFEKFIEDIAQRISEAFYNEITSGSYNDEEGRFDEGKLWMAHFFEFYDVEGQTEAEANSFFVTNTLTKENAFDSIAGTYDVYDKYVDWEANEADKENNPFKFRGYIEEKIFPQILKDKLVEEYVYNNNYSSLGRAYARQVAYIKISYESDVIPRRLLRQFAKDYIMKEENGSLADKFEIIAQALKGFKEIGDFKEATADGVKPLVAGDPAYDLLNTVFDGAGETITIDPANAEYYKLNSTVELLDITQPIFKETKLGEIIESYEKAIKAVKAGRFPTSVDKAELDKFLSSGKSMEYGLREKLLSLAKEDYTTDGWFIKNGGLSELPSVLRDRLFNINVANSLDDESLVRETVEAGTMGKYEVDASGKTLKRVPYLRNVYGHKFVIPAKSLPYAEDEFNYIYQDVEGKAFYIVEVLEAPSTAKLNKDAVTAYSQAGKTEDIAKAVAKVLGTKDSYIKDAYTEILKKYDFTFYETSLYEHFKSEYPDLFDEDED